MNLLLIFNLINCTEDEETNKISFVNKNITLLNKIDRKKRYIRFRRIKNGNYGSKTTKSPGVKLVSGCEENSKFQYYHYDLESLKYSTIFNLSYNFYEELLKHPKFILRCKKVGLDHNDLPSKIIFKNFIVKFITNSDFDYRDTKANKFIQSIAWLAHKHIVLWSQTHLTSYMRNKWSIVWQNIINSIHISTDRHCYWRVEFLFDGDQIAFANKQLEQLENGSISKPILYPTNIDHSYSQYAIENFIDPPLDLMIN